MRPEFSTPLAGKKRRGFFRFHVERFALGRKFSAGDRDGSHNLFAVAGPGADPGWRDWHDDAVASAATAHDPSHAPIAAKACVALRILPALTGL